MAVRLQSAAWARVSALGVAPHPAPRRRGGALGWLWPYWLLALVLAWALHSGRLAVRPWLPTREMLQATDEPATSSRAADAPISAVPPPTEHPAVVAAAAEPAHRSAAAARARAATSRRERAPHTAAQPPRPTAARAHRPASVAKRARARGGRGYTDGALPSCEAARAAHRERVRIGAARGAPDITPGAYAAVLDRGSYLTGCGVPESTAITICSAVQHGRAVGVTVHTRPPSARVARCVAAAVSRLRFASSERLDIATTVLAAHRRTTTPQPPPAIRRHP